MKKIFYTFALAFVCIAATGIALNDDLKAYLTTYNRNLPQEKIYVQTDKTFYKPTEQIWYKVFLLNANNHRASLTSDVAYIELLDAKGNVVQKHTHSIKAGNSFGSFELKDAVGGIYTLKAYTLWQKNFGEQAFFSKELTVQKQIFPRLLLKLDFEKRAYGAGDEVVADLKVTDLNNIATSGSQVAATVRIAGVFFTGVTEKTADGAAKIRFRLPADLSTTDGILQIMVRDKGVSESITRSVPIVLNKISLQFFPEGGDLVEDLPCRIAFEAQNEFGKGADITGEIRDENNVKVADFQSFHLGMGAFTFQPKQGKHYYAHITTPEGTHQPVPLPTAKTNAFLMHLEQNVEKELTWTIYSPEKTTAVLVGQTGGEIYFSKEIDFTQGSNVIKVPKDAFPAGIAVFTLFDGSGQERCERLVFLNENRKLNIEIETDEYVKQGEISKIRIKTTDEKGMPVAAKIGLSVVDEQLIALADDKQDNILTYLLLSSELKGNIQEPSFYFDKEEKKSAQAIDYLMLTHGWRRFSWNEVKNYQIQKQEFSAEKFSDIYGYVLDKKGKPVQAEVFLLRLDNYRANVKSKVKTTANGQFVFHGVNTATDLYITTKLPNQVYIFKGKPLIVEKKQTISTDKNTLIGGKKTETTAEKKPNTENTNIEFVGKRNDSGELNEVVVTGYGASADRAMMTGVTTRLEGIQVSSIEEALQGRVAGVEATSVSGTFGSAPKLRVRGASSIYGNSQPLVVIDGVVTEMEMANPQNIESIEVLKDAAATSIYGARAMNGVILITTKHGLSRTSSIKPKQRFGGVVVKKNNNREFYKSAYFVQNTHNPDQTSSTVFWNGNVETDKNGKAEISFRNNLQSSVFRITAEGFAPNNGLIGAAKKKIVTSKPLSVDMKLPLFAAVGDTIIVPVMVRNVTDKSLNVLVDFEIVTQDSAFLRKIGNDTLAENAITILPNETFTVNIPVVSDKDGSSEIKVSVKTSKYEDDIAQNISTYRAGFPYSYAFSGKDAGQTQQFQLPDYVAGSLKADLVCYSDFLDEIFDGVESIFREPYGCFEQVSSSTFPNIFALQLLQQKGLQNSEIQTKALQYIENGYKKLANYEISGGGFEWFGKPPAHEGLTAYGIVEFAEMSKVYDKVDKKLIERAVKFLMKRKDGNGGFDFRNGLDGFSFKPKRMCDAYIVYALSETGYAQQVQAEYASTVQEALKSGDMYRMALMANTAFNFGDKENYTKLLAKFTDFIAKSDFEKMKIEATLVYSSGSSQYLETTAFWLMALLRNTSNLDMPLIDKTLQFIQNKRQSGRFGNSQSTAVCLQALSHYAMLQNTTLDQNGAAISFNGSTYNIPSKGKLGVNIADKLKKGENTLDIAYQNIVENYPPYAVNISWYATLPPSSEKCPLALTSTLAQQQIKVNETLRLHVTLKNKAGVAQPMSVAIIGIPGGLSLQHWQLKELQEKEVFDFYEIIDDRLVIYYRELAPNDLKTIDLDLKADVAGTYTGRASSAYLYYSDEQKMWIKGLKIKITE